MLRNLSNIDQEFTKLLNLATFWRFQVIVRRNVMPQKKSSIPEVGSFRLIQFFWFWEVEGGRDCANLGQYKI